VGLEHTPVTFMTYAPWAATATLVGLLLATWLTRARLLSALLLWHCSPISAILVLGYSKNSRKLAVNP